MSPIVTFVALATLLGKTTNYNAHPEKAVPIALIEPSKYECLREPVEYEDDKVLVRVTCRDLHDNGTVSFGTICDKKNPKSTAAMMIDVSPTQAVVPALFMVSCSITEGIVL